MASTWLVVSEIDGTVVLSSGETKEEAVEKSGKALVDRGSGRAAGSGVIELDHTLRAARVVVFRRAGQAYDVRPEVDEKDEKSIGVPGAYDILCPFGYDIDRELAAGHQPPAERVTPFVQKLAIPIVISKKVESHPSRGSVTKDDRMRMTAIGAAIVVLLIVVVAVIYFFKLL